MSRKSESAITVLDAYNNRYLATHTPMAFAVSESGGTYDYYYCEAA